MLASISANLKYVGKFVLQKYNKISLKLKKITKQVRHCEMITCKKESNKLQKSTINIYKTIKSVKKKIFVNIKEC